MVCLILLFVCRQNAKATITFVIRRIALSLFGRVLKSIREDENSNVVNVSDINEMTENTLYVEGSIVTRTYFY